VDDVEILYTTDGSNGTMIAPSVLVSIPSWGAYAWTAPPGGGAIPAVDVPTYRRKLAPPR